MSSAANMLGLPSHSVVTEKGAECLWYLRVDPGQRIKVTFTRVPTDDCNTTQFRVVNPNHQICSSRGSPSVVVSKQNEVKILFQSEQAYQQLTSYFLVYYSSICGGSLEVTLLTKKMYSHNGEGKRNYPPGSNCTWTLRAADEKYVIHVESDDFQLEESDNCKSDYVLIDNNRYCGHQSFILYKSTSPVVLIKFVSDNDTEDGGFRIKYYATET
ncbi:bone morphogenetic protein 1-like [Corticium candelabrum]|uniref:bone morphogenetic protein 1-like n=1 Tax=Corticium candelabrum TaxID=121492 RepID=UPI002E2759F5|nr:bone morphogenetic protein 1-like [Corticium candelabrum]